MTTPCETEFSWIKQLFVQFVPVPALELQRYFSHRLGHLNKFAAGQPATSAKCLGQRDLLLQRSHCATPSSPSIHSHRLLRISDIAPLWQDTKRTEADEQRQSVKTTMQPSTHVLDLREACACFAHSCCLPAFSTSFMPAKAAVPLRTFASQLIPQKRKRCEAPVMVWKPAGLLREAVQIKRVEVEMMEDTLTERPDHPINMRRAFYAQRPTHRFSNALRRRDGTLAVVAAIKRFQPPNPGEKAELITPFEDIGPDTRALECCGVDAAMFYTDSIRYGMDVAEMTKAVRHLKTSTQDSGLPLARQDIIIDPVQIAEAAEAGACAVNIVASAALPEVPELLDAATAMGIEAIVECHNEIEVEYALESGATIVFLTNFDRTRNKVVPGTALRLVENLPPWVMKLGGGGLRTAGDCWDYLDAGFNGVVLGRTLLETGRPSGFIEEIRAQKRFTGDVFAGGFGAPFSEEMDLDSAEKDKDLH